ncbi:MAG TPA: LysR substrate-binding domain-containing protein, partial [Candidatus Binatia bacterium]
RRLIERLLLASEIEVGLVAGHPPSDLVVAEPYGKYKMVAIAPKNHPLAKKSAVTASELAGMPLVIRGDPSRKSTTENLLTGGLVQGLKLNIAIRCESPEAVKIAVREGMGIGILYEDAVKAEIKKGRFKILKLSDLNLEGESWIVYRRDKPLSPLAREFVRLLWERRHKDRRTSATVRYRKKKNVAHGRSKAYGLPRSSEPRLPKPTAGHLPRGWSSSNGGTDHEFRIVKFLPVTSSRRQ